MGRSRLVSARSWNFSCWMIWVRKNAPSSTRNTPLTTQRATRARSPSQYESKPFVMSRRSGVEPDGEPLAEEHQHHRAQPAGDERLEGAQEDELEHELPLRGPAREQQHQVAHP